MERFDIKFLTRRQVIALRYAPLAQVRYECDLAYVDMKYAFEKKRPISTIKDALNRGLSLAEWRIKAHEVTNGYFFIERGSKPFYPHCVTICFISFKWDGNVFIKDCL